MSSSSAKNALISALQGASNAAASNVSGPVDLLAWALRKAGVPVPSNAFGGSEWMRQQGLTAEPTNKLAGMLGEGVGLAAPFAIAAKAPQIAGAMNKADDALTAGANRMADHFERTGAAYRYDPKQRGAVGDFKYPQQKALDTAQRNAAKPVSEGGLGLPPNNTPMDRAVAMGFDVDYEMMHGTAKNIKAFDPQKLGSTTQAKSAELGVFTTDNTDQATFYAAAAARRAAFEKSLLEMSRGSQWKEVAKDLGLNPSLSQTDRIDALRKAALSSLSDPMSEAASVSQLMKRGGVPAPVGGEAVYPLMTRYSNPLLDDFGAQMKTHGNLTNSLSNAKKLGHDHVILKDVTEGSNTALWDVHFNPSNIRSRFAAFDPMKRNSGNLLAGAVPLAYLSDEETRNRLIEALKGPR